MQIKSLIIDDDPFIQQLLSDKLTQFFPEVIIMDTASSGREGVKKINHYQPQLLFLDVEMTDMTGFEMLSFLDDISFQTIFITSYSHYAIKAIRFNALDYLVKPIDLGELRQAIRRYKIKAKRKQAPTNVQQAIQNMKTEKVSHQKLMLQTQEGELRLMLKDIVRIEGERNYSYIFLTNHRKKLISKTLSNFEELLTDKGFFRCHKSHLVNGYHIQSYNSYLLTTSDGMEVPIARRKKEGFKDWYGQF